MLVQWRKRRSSTDIAQQSRCSASAERSLNAACPVGATRMSSRY